MRHLPLTFLISIALIGCGRDTQNPQAVEINLDNQSEVIRWSVTNSSIQEIFLISDEKLTDPVHKEFKLRGCSENTIMVDGSDQEGWWSPLLYMSELPTPTIYKFASGETISGDLDKASIATPPSIVTKKIVCSFKVGIKVTTTSGQNYRKETKWIKVGKPTP